jgi:DNA/RNA endonuclease G (NUC1)
VHEILNLATITGDAERRGSFFPDPNIHPSKFAVTNDYYFSTNAWRVHHLNRGHMAAAGNYSGNQEQKYSTVFLAVI